MLLVGKNFVKPSLKKNVSQAALRIPARLHCKYVTEEIQKKLSGFSSTIT